jgi:hypothetical protein
LPFSLAIWPSVRGGLFACVNCGGCVAAGW